MPPLTTVLSGKRHDAALILYEADWHDGEIGEAFGISRQSVYVWRKKYNLARKYNLRIDSAKALELYGTGMTDRAIAQELGVTQAGISVWRSRQGLGLNFSKTAPISTADVRKAKALLRQGASRRQVAEAIGRCENSVTRLRRQMKDEPGLRIRGQTVRAARRGAVKNADALYRRIVCAIGKGVCPHDAAEAVQDLYLAVLEDRVKPHQIEAKAQQFKNRVTGMFASKYGPRSLDEEIGAGGWTLGHTLVDPDAEANMQEALFRGYSAPDYEDDVEGL